MTGGPSGLPGATVIGRLRAHPQVRPRVGGDPAGQSITGGPWAGWLAAGDASCPIFSDGSHPCDPAEWCMSDASHPIFSDGSHLCDPAERCMAGGPPGSPGAIVIGPRRPCPRVRLHALHSARCHARTHLSACRTPAGMVQSVQVGPGMPACTRGPLSWVRRAFRSARMPRDRVTQLGDP